MESKMSKARASTNLDDKNQKQQAEHESIQRIKSALKRNGYFNATLLSTTLQGSVWTAPHPETKKLVVIKATSKALHHEQVVVIDDKKYRVQENIFKERAILKYLTAKDKNAPKSIVQYIDWFTDEYNYFLVMEHGGHSLFNFTLKVHGYIESGQIAMNEWHKLVQLLFNQM